MEKNIIGCIIGYFIYYFLFKKQTEIKNKDIELFEQKEIEQIEENNQVPKCDNLWFNLMK